MLLCFLVKQAEEIILCLNLTQDSACRSYPTMKLDNKLYLAGEGVEVEMRPEDGEGVLVRHTLVLTLSHFTPLFISQRHTVYSKKTGRPIS